MHNVPYTFTMPFVGVKLLLKMGWRHGHSIKETHAESLYGNTICVPLFFFHYACSYDIQLLYIELKR